VRERNARRGGGGGSSPAVGYGWGGGGAGRWLVRRNVWVREGAPWEREIWIFDMQFVPLIF
jgi:hypothetical protein